MAGGRKKFDLGNLHRKYLRAAEQRFSSASLLLERSLTVDAVYLGGYVVECAMKGLILARTSRANWPATLERITRGSAGHDLVRLRRFLQQRGCTPPAEAAEALRRLASWTVDLRYEVGPIAYNEAAELIRSAQVLLEWVRRSM